jgi:hypothetical protein
VYKQKQTNNTVNNDENHKAIDVEEASGLQDLDYGGNYGNANDYWKNDISGFSTNTYPSTALYSGAYADVGVYDISGSSLNDPMTFTIGGVKAGGQALFAYPSPFSYAVHEKMTFLVDNESPVFSGQTLFRQTLKLFIYNGSGKKVAVLENFNADYYTEWDGRDVNGERLPEGVYYAALKSDVVSGYAGRFLITHR